MPTPKNRLPLAGSERAPMPGAQEAGPVDPNEQIEVTLRLRSRAGKIPIVSPEEYSKPIKERALLSRGDYEQRHGADPASIAKVEAFAKEFGLTVKESSLPRRTVILSGTVAAMGEAFGVELKMYQAPTCRYRGRSGAVHIPAELADVVEGVFGLDDRPQAKPHFRRRREQTGASAAAANTSYTPPQIAGFYQFSDRSKWSGRVHRHYRIRWRLHR